MTRTFLFMPDELYSCVVIPENIVFAFNAVCKRNSKYLLIEYNGKEISIARYNNEEQKLKYLDAYWDRETIREIGERFLSHLSASEKFTI